MLFLLRSQNFIRKRFLVVFIFLFSCFARTQARAVDAYSKEQSLHAAKFVFEVDQRRWDPPQELISSLTSTSVGDLSNAIIHLLFERYSFQNVSVVKLSNESDLVFEIKANRVPKVGEVGFRGLTASQIQQIRQAIKTRVGFPYVEEEAERDRESIQKRLADRGYQIANVGRPETALGVSGELKVVFPVDLQTPCRIAEVQTEPDAGMFDYFATPIDLGSLCDRAAIEEILERQKARLVNEGYLSSELTFLAMDISPDKQRASIRIRYVRGPRTRLEIVNRQSGAVMDALSEFKEKISAFDVMSLSDDELRADVRRIFVNRGYTTSVVTGPTRVTEPNGDAVIRFFVQTGPLVVVGDVQFVGELPLPRQDVLEKLELVPKFLEGAVPYVEESLSRYRDRLISLYLDEGFAEVRVADPIVSFAQDGRSVKIIFETKPGYRSVLRDVTILGRPFDFSLTKNFQERILQPGQHVNAQKLKNLEDEIRLELMNAGYAYARIQVMTKSLPPAGEIKPIQVTVDLNPGPLVRIGKIYAEGDSFGKQERIISESGLRTNDLFTPDALEQARTRILKHDLFDSVLVEPFSPEAIERKDSVLDLVIRLSAKKSYSLGLSPGYGTRSGYRFNVDFAKNNLTSDGLRFTSTLLLSQEKLQNSVLSNQRIMGRKLTAGLMEPLLRIGQYVSPLDWSAVSGVEVSAQSLSDRYFETFETGVSWRPIVFDRSLTFQARLLHEWSKAIGQDIKPLEALERPTVTIRELIVASSFDSRDSPEWPTRGLTLDLSANYARFGLLSDVRYDRYSVDSSWFFPVFKRLSGALNIGGLKVSDVVNAQAEGVTAPSSRRATLAGRAIVRGFPEASSTVTPGPLLWLNFQPPEANPGLVCQPTVKPIGATNVLYAKGELRVRSPWLGESLGFAGFLDSGAAFFTGAELQRLQDRLTGGDNRLDPGSIDQCALKTAKVLGDNPVNFRSKDFLKEYYFNSYVSTGLGIRYIISNFASVNVDIGFPLREPRDVAQGAQCAIPTDIPNQPDAPVCVKRSSTSRLFGLFPVPGAYHLGIGANF